MRGKKRIYICGAVLILLVAAYTAQGFFADITRPAPGDNMMNVNLYFFIPASNTLGREVRAIETPASNTELIKAVLAQLIAGPAKSGYARVVPRDVVITEARFNEQEKLVSAYISEEFYNLPVREQLFLRASLVWTLTEFDFIDDVSVFVSQRELTAASGQAADRLNRENLALNPRLSP